jgi:alpha-L-rhamnosidase
MLIESRLFSDVWWGKAEPIYITAYHGLIVSDWKKTGGKFMLHAEIPPNTTAEILLPATKNAVITEGGKAIAAIKELKLLRYANGRAVIRAGSGSYHFSVI